MEQLPFSLRDHQRVEGGMRLVFGCAACGADAPLVLRDADPLQAKYAVACGCGAQVVVFFGSPLLGRALLRSLREVPDACEYVGRAMPSLN